MQAILTVLEFFWNLKFIKGHRTQVARVLLSATAAAIGYQGLATSADLMKAGINLPDLSANLLLTLAGLSAYFSNKVVQFSKEHAPA